MAKKNNKKIFGINIVFLILTIISIISSIIIEVEENRTNIIFVISAIINAIIFVVLSLLPIWNDILLKKKALLNPLSDTTFTDREKDVQNILKKLIQPEKSIEIFGNDHRCGKTWLAKKICDIINNNMQRDYSINNKLPYNRAFYIDMESEDEKSINDFISNNTIDKKTLLVFDNVENLDFILSKQSYYHFSMIFIKKNIVSETNLYCHRISNFSSENIGQLQSKINQKYSSIETISSKEISTLYEITNGNIGKIHTMLSSQTYINWLKQISQEEFTDYDIDLNKIQIELFSGNYFEADKKLRLFNENYHDYFDNDDLFFKYQIMKSDCLHLLNQYQLAITTINLLNNNKYTFANKNNRVELLSAHYYKHLWECNNALRMLEYIEQKNADGLINKLGIYAAQFFINENGEQSLENFKKTFINATLRVDELDELQKMKLKRYSIVYNFYNNVSLEKLIDDIDEIINLYFAQNNRLIANAYFLKGEIYRMFNQYDLAIQNYLKCQTITEDNNIKIQVAVMLYYLNYIKNISIPKQFLCTNLKEIRDMCYDNMEITNEYGNKLVKLLNCIELNDEISEFIKKQFETRVMVIL